MADAVLIQVLPQLDLGERSVVRIEDAITVAGRADDAVACVQGAQGLEAVAGVAGDGVEVERAGNSLGDGDQGVDAKEFAATVDAAVAVTVEHEPGVVAFEPARAGLDAIGVVVEQDGVTAGRDADGFDAVTVEVDGQRVTAGWGGGSAPVCVGQRVNVRPVVEDATDV